MESVTVTRDVEASPEFLRERIRDVGPFMRAAGFDGVEVEGETIRLRNTVGLFFEIELTLEVVEREDAVLAYEQRDGIFEEMETVYTLDGRDGHSTVSATTEFAIGVAYAGPAFDATIVTRQRRAELTAQFDYLESEAR